MMWYKYTNEREALRGDLNVHVEICRSGYENVYGCFS